jgi:hypothetical protein
MASLIYNFRKFTFKKIKPDKFKHFFEDWGKCGKNGDEDTAY